MAQAETTLATEIGAFVDSHPVSVICDLLGEPLGANVAAVLFQLACSDRLPESIVELARQLYLETCPTGLRQLATDFSPRSLMRH